MADGGGNTASATYNPGGVSTVTYPGGRVLTYEMDAIGRTAGLRTGASDYFVSAASYAAHGGARSMTFGNGQTETQTWNHRLQTTGISRGAAFSLAYAYCATGASCATNDGNVVSQTIGHAANAKQSYEFDELGRLKKATEGTAWSRTYGADRWGNSWVSANTGVTLASFTPVASSNFDTNNRLQLQGATYDGAGNQTKIGGFDFEYDGEGKVSKSTLNSAVTTNHYDGEGRRVKKVSGSRTVVYVYGVGGELIEEYDTVAPAETGRQYLAQDVLGSTRAVFSAAGAVVRCLDYLPYGEQIPQGVGSGRSGACWAGSEEPRVRFTGKERDQETGLDYFGARYYAGAQGRFASPDPVQMGLTRVADPQRWNLYSYGRNNPLKFVDPDGMEVTVFTEIQKQGHTFVQIHNYRHNVIFSYGRYAGGSSGSNARGLNPIGPGILIRIEGDQDVAKFLADRRAKDPTLRGTRVTVPDEDASYKLLQDKFEHGKPLSDEEKAILKSRA